MVGTVVAAVLPLSALLLAGRWATGEVTASTLAGERSTATAVGQQVDQSYDDTDLAAALDRLPRGGPRISHSPAA